MLRGKRIVVGVCGGIAAYKAAWVVRELMRRGAEVRVVMTKSAGRFIAPITFTGLTGTPAVVDLWNPSYAGEVHVELGGWADAVLVVPATMNTMGKLASGVTDDALLATVACARGEVVLAPAMHHLMWNRGSTQRAKDALAQDGVTFLGPVDGPLASGESGMGRLMEPEAIVDGLERVLGNGDLSGRSILVTAGPTVEDLDPVRFLGNRSTGKMGFALAERAAARGAEVTLIAGPVALPTPPGVARVDIRSARELHAEVKGRSADVIIMAAAVADYRPKTRADQKIKKSGVRTLELVRNPDILAELGAERQGARPVLVGFALETEKVVEHARGKLTRKGADLIVANHAKDSFGKATNVATLVTAGDDVPLDVMSKPALADRILDRIHALLSGDSR